MFFICYVCTQHIKAYATNNIHPNTQNIDCIINQAYKNRKDHEISYKEFETVLQEYSTDPMNLNESSIEDLEMLSILTTSQIEALFDHISKYGKLLSIYELQTIPYFDLDTIHKLLPFVYVEESLLDDRNNAFTPKGMNSRESYISVHYKRKLLSQRDYAVITSTETPRHIGSPDEILTKIRIRHLNKYDIGISTKKSAGEAFVWDHRSHIYGFSVYRVHLMLEDKGLFKRLIIGSYDIGYGEGLINETGFSMDDDSDNIKLIKTKNTGIQLQTSPKKIKYNGVATTLQWQLIELSLYYSVVVLDQTIKDRATPSEHIESEINRSCNYRTIAEIERRNSLKEYVTGATIVYHSIKKEYELGLSILFSKFSIPFSQEKDENRDAFSGDASANGSTFYRFIIKNINFFGESGFSKNISNHTLQTKRLSPATINGVVMSLSTVDITLLHRYYSAAYNCFYGKPFTGISKPCNEYGFYIGLSYAPAYQWYFDTCFDYARIIHIKKEQNPNVYCWMVKSTYKPNRMMHTSIKYKESRKQSKVTDAETELYGYTSTYKNEAIRKLKAQYRYAPNTTIACKSELHINRYQKLKSSTWGYGIIQDFSYKIGQVKITGRLGWFDPQSTKNAVCTYEPGLLYAGYTFPRYTRTGILLCSIICYKPSLHWRIEIKYSHVYIIGSRKGMNNKNDKKSNIENTINAQLIYSF